MRVEEILFVMREAPLCHDRSATTHDTGHPRRGEGDKAQEHARVNREVIDALLRLFDERVAEDLPAKVFNPSVHFLKCLIDRHRSDRHRRVANNPLTSRVNVLPCREIHDRVAAPKCRPLHFLDLFIDR